MSVLRSFLASTLLTVTLLCSPVTLKATIFNILDYGAKGDGKTMNTSAIQKAIDACNKAGGGTVYFPAGRFVSGTIILKSFVTVQLAPGSILEGSRNIKDYVLTVPKIRSYTDNYTNKSLIYAEGAEKVALTGQGTIDGNGASFRMPDEMMKTDLFASYKARPYLIRMISCTDILVDGITILNSPMWVQHYLECRNVNIDGITVRSQVNHNNDGIDIDGCDNVRISNCDIVSGDDAIVIKSTTDRLCSNVVVTNCVLSTNCNAFKLGTESNGGFHNISFSNSVIYNTRLAGIALEMVDGGSLNNITISNINMDNVSCAIFVRLGNRARPYKENMTGIGMGDLFNVMISNVQAQNTGKTGCSITGLPGHPVKDLILNNINISFKGGGTADLIDKVPEEFPEKYPEYGMFGSLPAYGFYCRHAGNIIFENIKLGYSGQEARPAFQCDDVKGIRFSGIDAAVAEKTPVMIFKNVSDALIHSSIDRKNGAEFVKVSGDLNRNIDYRP